MGKDKVVESGGIIRKQETTQLKNIGNRVANRRGSLKKVLPCVEAQNIKERLN